MITIGAPIKRAAIVLLALTFVALPVLTMTDAEEAPPPSTPLRSLSESQPAFYEVTTTTAPPTTTTAAPTTTTTAPPPPATTSTTAAPAPPPRPPATGACAGWEDTIAAYFPAEQVSKACSVMMCETGGTGDPTIYNRSGSGASGMWQFMPSTWESTTGTPAPAANYSGDTQTAAAAKLWRSGGWSQWSCA